MKTAASIQSSMFFNSALPTTGTWGPTRQRIVRRQPSLFRLPALTTDDFAATKQEIVCGSVLAVCLFYTFAQCFIQLAS